jgi:uncharacterized membrane protein
MSEQNPAPRRLLALDQLRGMVMVLMTIDHASEWLNEGRFVTDASWFWKPGTPIPTDQFLLRWITHLCAPTFVFLAGVGIALSTLKRRALGDTDAAIDRQLLLRGLFIVALEVLWMNPAMMKGTGILLQVLYAIGCSMMLMVPLRRVPAKALGYGALAFFGLSELLAGVAIMASGGQTPSWPAALLLTSGLFPIELGPLKRLIAAYPVLPWAAIMALGYACASFFTGDNKSGAIERKLLAAGAAALALFGVVRGWNGYGNMQLYRDNLEPMQWLHVSKYPPSLSYLTLELGIMALCLAALYRLERARVPSVLAGLLSALAVLGQAALFFYVIHIHVIGLGASLLGVIDEGGIGATLLGTALCLGVLALPVARYRRYKIANPNGFTRYL